MLRDANVGPLSRALALFLLPAVAATSVARAQDRIVDTVHNLSVGGPGTTRAADEDRVCIFCHAPHRTTGQQPLWNRDASSAAYRIYRSSTLDARPRQPTGASKLCLSCHDGTIALGKVFSRQERIRMAGGDFMPPGRSNLGTDLSDDHPVSFLYSHGLAAADRQLESPAALPPEVRLDHAGEMQCTSCHDAHDDRNGDFLVMDDRFGRLCTSCHRMDGWDSSSHRTSSASVGPALGATDFPHATVAENACRSCHRTHAAGRPERLLRHEREEENCLSCHDGRVAKTDLRRELDKRSAHDPRRATGRHDPEETDAGERAHVECSDCHDPHSAAPLTKSLGYVPLGPTLRGASGVTTGGARVREASHEYEVCFRCHGDRPVRRSRRVERLSDSSNLREAFAASAESAHPVVTPSRAGDTVSLVPDLAPGSLLRCTDCHNNDDGPGAGGAGPAGPHGSDHPFLLERNYSVLDGSRESEFTYALCYKCHRRSSILNDESFSGHRLHVERLNTPCSACHDPHGVSRVGGGSGRSDHTHLVNFDTTIVRPEPRSGRLEFEDRGRFSGSCTLECHGTRHVDFRYPSFTPRRPGDGGGRDRPTPRGDRGDRTERRPEPRTVAPRRRSGG